MRRRAPSLKDIFPSAYRAMWLVAMFDLPVDSPANRRNYARFRAALLKDGFMMLQFSVYARHVAGEEAAAAHRRIVRSAVPPLGQVRVMAVTDQQFARMEVYYGRKPRPAEAAPAQIMLF